MLCSRFFFQAEDGIRYLVRSRGLGDVYKRQQEDDMPTRYDPFREMDRLFGDALRAPASHAMPMDCLLYTSDAADERSSVDLGGRRIINKKNKRYKIGSAETYR